MKIGVLALQGNFENHFNKIIDFGETPIYVKTKADLFKCDALIIPGGESTVMSKMLDYNDLRKSIIDLKDKINIMGICAGMILLSSTNGYRNLDTLSIMNFEVERNGFGRQINSFNSKIRFIPTNNDIKVSFIRAPKISTFSNENICLAKLNDSPIMLSDRRHIACSFHPEFSSNHDIYKYFINLVESC